jgi:hypothetical protein
MSVSWIGPRRNEAYEEGKSGFITNFDKEVLDAKWSSIVCADEEDSS